MDSHVANDVENICVHSVVVMVQWGPFRYLLNIICICNGLFVWMCKESKLLCNESEWYVVTCLFEIKLHKWNLLCCHEFDEWFADVDTCILFSTSLCDVYLYKIQSL